MPNSKNTDNIETGVGPAAATTTGNISSLASRPSNNNSPYRARGKNKIGWIIAGTAAFLLIIGLAVGLNRSESEQTTPVVTPAVTTADDGNKNTTYVSSEADTPNAHTDPSSTNEPAVSENTVSEGDEPTGVISSADGSEPDQSLSFEPEHNLPGDFALFEFTEEMTDASSVSASSSPTSLPTESPEQSSSSPSKKPTTNSPSMGSSTEPSASPMQQPTDAPTTSPTKGPSVEPTVEPTASPTEQPSSNPSAVPTKVPTKSPTNVPTISPSSAPSNKPKTEPTKVPTTKPVLQLDFSNWGFINWNTNPTSTPSKIPTVMSSLSPSNEPTQVPTPYPNSSATQSPTTGEPTATFSFYSEIGQDLFDDERGLEASGVDIAPDGSHLVIVADGGEVIFLNLLDYNSGSCMIDLSNEVDGKKDFEGVAIDPTIWNANDMHAYVVHEGGDDSEPVLHKIKYDFDHVAGRCNASLVDSKSLYGAIPCLETSNGIESLALKSASSATDPAVFFVGIQDTGKVYEVTSEGLSNGPNCYDGGMGVDDISASTYNFEHGHIWSFIESETTIAVVDVARDCAIALYPMSSSLDESLDEEGLAIDFERGIMYLVVDGQGDGSVVSVYNFTYPQDLNECMDNGVRPGSCSNFTVCGDGQV